MDQNPDLSRGLLFRTRARELLEFLKKQERPCLLSEEELGKGVFIGGRSIRRYLRFLKAEGKIDIQYAHHRVGESGWNHYRKIIVLED